MNNNFYGESEINQYITIKKWILNYKFPFIHRLTIKKKLKDWQIVMNKKWNETFDLYANQIKKV